VVLSFAFSAPKSEVTCGMAFMSAPQLPAPVGLSS
jgi:hypothetical protein